MDAEVDAPVAVWDELLDAIERRSGCEPYQSENTPSEKTPSENMIDDILEEWDAPIFSRLFLRRARRQYQRVTFIAPSITTFKNGTFEAIQSAPSTPGRTKAL